MGTDSTERQYRDINGFCTSCIFTVLHLNIFSYFSFHEIALLYINGNIKLMHQKRFHNICTKYLCSDHNDMPFYWLHKGYPHNETDFI